MLIKKQAFLKKFLLNSKGFSSTFINKKTILEIENIVSIKDKKHLPNVEGNISKVLNYTNLSILYNSNRKVPFVSAYNIDGNKKEKVLRTSFRTDPRIPIQIQLNKKHFYKPSGRQNNQIFEIGHMAANNELAWGKNAQLKSYQTFFFPNSVPQAKKLNTGLWRILESYIIKEAIKLASSKKICVFTGPVLRKNDPYYVNDLNFKVPLLFYKVIVFPAKKGVFATGFIMSHEKRLIEMKSLMISKKKQKFMRIHSPDEFSSFPYKKVFQVNIDYLESLTGLNFTWKGVSNVKVPKDINQLKKIRKIAHAKEAAIQTSPSKLKSKFPSKSETLEFLRTEKPDYKLNIILP